MNVLVYALTLFVVEPAPAPPVELRRYDSATECDIAVRTVRILQRGVRLQCVPHELSIEERQARAWALALH